MVVLHTCRNSKRPYQAGSRFSRFVEQGTPQYCRNPQCRTAIRNTTASNKCNDANQWLLEEAVSRISRVKNNIQQRQRYMYEEDFVLEELELEEAIELYEENKALDE